MNNPTTTLSLFIASALYVATASANYSSKTIWHMPNNTGTSVSYNVEWAGITYDLPAINSWEWGMPYIAATVCSGHGQMGDANVYNLLSFPQTVEITRGYNAKITVTGDSGSGRADGWVSGIGYSTYNGSDKRLCLPVGSLAGNPYTPASSKGLTSKITFPAGIPPGVYNVRIRAGVGQMTSSSTPGTPKPMYSANEIIPYLKSTPVDINLSVTIVNSCSIGPAEVLLDHRTLIYGEADGHTTSKFVQVNCTGPTKLRLKLIQLTPPQNAVPGEYRAGLGNGWDSILKLNGKSSLLEMNLLNSSNTPIQIESTLSRGQHSTTGMLDGAAIMIMEPY